MCCAFCHIFTSLDIGVCFQALSSLCCESLIFLPKQRRVRTCFETERLLAFSKPKNKPRFRASSSKVYLDNEGISNYYIESIN